MNDIWKKDYPLLADLTEEGLDENNSLKKMLSLVGRNKRVIEFGCATGYFSQMLSNRGCKVTAVENNSDAAKVAEQYCEQVIVADLDLVYLPEILPQQSFDVAVFGDVLEHLRDPWKVLKETQQLLNFEGYIVASIPNIAHGAIRLALLQGKFEYTELGILDNTHLRFFTRKTVEDLFESSGYFVETIDRTKLAVFSGNPLIPRIDKAEFSSELIKQIEQEKEAETLQFILRAFPSSEAGKYAGLNERYDKIVEQLERSQAQLQHTQTQLEQLQAQMQQAQAEVERSQSEKQQLQSFMQQAQTEMERSQAQLQHTQTQLEQLQAQMQQAQAEVERSQSEKQQLQSQLGQTQTELNRLQSQLTLSSNEVARMQSSKVWQLHEQWLSFKKLLSFSKQFLFAVDSPTGREVVISNFQITGWCISTGKVSIKALRARVGEKTFDGIFGLHRPDLVQAYGVAGAEESGFQIQLHLSPGAKYQVLLEALDSLNKWHVIGSHSVTVSTLRAVFDAPTVWEQQSNNILFSGWCCHPKEKINRLVLSCGKICLDCSYGYYRKDVQETYPDWTNSGQTGFVVSASIPAGKWQVTLTAYLETGEVVTVQPPEKLIVRPPSFWSKQKHQLQQQNVDSTAADNFFIPQTVDNYQAWLEVNQWNERSSSHLRSRLKACQSNLPKISVVMPVFNPQICFLESAIASVVNQVYDNWELCIADDCSSDPVVQATLNQWAARDARIHVVFREENGNISAATNSAANLATGDFLLFLDHDDQLTADALGEVALYLVEHPKTDFLYSDDDKIDTEGHRFAPQFKPDWSPELLLSYMYLSHLSVVKRSIFEQVGGLRVGFEGSQDYDFALRATEIADHVGHLPQVLYHWRVIPGSTAESGAAKPNSFVAAQTALQEALNRRKISGNVYQPDWSFKAKCGIFDIEFPNQGPSVAIIIPTKNQLSLLKACLNSLEKTTYQNYQIVVIDNESDDPETLAYLEQISHRVIRLGNPNGIFNFAAINNQAAEQVESDYLLFLNNDTEVISEQWLSQMIGYAQFQSVGAVGARLLYPDQRIQHAGIIHGLYNGLAGPAFKLLPSWNNGYLSYAKVTRNYSAITAACLLTPRHLFLEMGGFDQKQFAVAYNDVDYCYRLVDRGYRCVYCPTAELIHKEGSSRGFVDNPKELAAFKQKYSSKFDPWYNPHLALSDEQFKIQPRRVFFGSVKPIKTLMCAFNLNWEGAPYSQYEMTVKLKKLGVIEPIVYSPQNGPLKEDYEKEGIKVYVEDHPLKGVTTLEAYNQAISTFAKFIEKLEIELIYGNTLQTFYAIAAAKYLGLPSIWNPRESEPWQNYFNYLSPEISSRALECFRFPYRVVFVSNATKDRFLELNTHHNFAVIHNALNLNRIEEVASQWTRKTARESLNISEQEVVILLLGTICKRKGQQDLALALADLPQEWHSKIKVFIVGDRPNDYSFQLKNIVASLPDILKQRIFVLPEKRDTAQYYRAADIFICTSQIESFPRVILEAMVYGLPIITTPVFGIKEQVQEGVNAIFYTPGHTKELATAIVSLLQNKAQRLRLAENSAYVLACLNTFEDMAQSYAQIFREAYFSQAC